MNESKSTGWDWKKDVVDQQRRGEPLTTDHGRKKNNAMACISCNGYHRLDMKIKVTGDGHHVQ